ncbi:MAG: glycosyltransferase [Bacteroidales bacterium]|nr:glycosyltransferase [Bacteroidales bacterium]
MPSVSIIVPVYNTEKYLSRCIDSILAQTFSDFELILVDDGSTDNSGKICDEYAKKDSRIIVIHKENGGASSARNKGLEIAQGEWITFVDSDDFITNNFIGNLYDQEFDMTICGMTINSKEIIIDNQIINYNNIPEIIIYLYNLNLINGPYSKIFKYSIIKQNNLKFDESLRSGEDTHFVFKYLKYTTKLKLISECGYIYNQLEIPEIKYNLSSIETHHHIIEMHKVIDELSIKYSNNFYSIKSGVNYWYHTKFIEHLKKCNYISYINEINSYQKLGLFRYRPKLSLKELTYLWLKIHLPKIFYKLEHKN